MKKIFLAVLAASGVMNSCWASEWTPFLGGGLTAGGDKVTTTQYVTGDTQNLHAGGLVDLRAGLDFRMVGTDISLQGMVAYHTDRSNADNGSVDFSRMPLELLVQWHANEKWAFAGGVRKAIGVRYNGSDAGTQFGSDQKFKSSMGWILEGEYAIIPSVGLKVRYVKEDYTSKAANGLKLDGSHFGVLGVYYFR
ncbi:hypothetical protein [Aquabacterium sp.]|uniref:hypothetical protein n=1 Tax=Aquabacterium sp. TaxID=1872578 RepID=UPI002487F1B0|nr:hypothetical protein [Aquabacterium sp.]MDI1261554.1 hypothetical protein [Aquabacterium sp.]